jgi:RNA polymerase sigma factor (TIGR02999 family)
MRDNVTRILAAVEQGDPSAPGRLLPLVYEELRKLASHRLSQEKAGHTLQATALVHEAYLRLVDVDDPQQWNGRGHFFAAAAEAMRRILIDGARRKRRPKHGGDRERVDLDEAAQLSSEPAADDLLALDEALKRFAKREPLKAKLVELRFFAGLTIPQAAAALNISEASAERYWAYARAWLHGELDPLPNDQKNPLR